MKLGDEKLKANKQRYNAINEVFGAFKEVKLSGLENEYLKDFLILLLNMQVIHQYQELLDYYLDIYWKFWLLEG